MLLFKPHAGPQTRFMAYTGRYALMGGAAMGGKSECLRWDPWRQILNETKRVNRGEIARSTGRSIFFRRTMPELREVMDRCQRDFKLIDPGANWHEQTKTWTMSCGYKYMFGQMEEASDWVKYYGFEFSWIGFDELTTFTEEQFDQLDTRLRSTDPVLKDMLYLRAATNPVGTGLEWVRRRFVEIAEPGKPVKVKVKVKVREDGIEKQKTVIREQIFIPARVSDNPSADQAEYAATLTTKAKATREALLEGNWYASSESCFSDFWDSSVHICKPFKIPRGWTKYRCGDFGTAWPGLSSIQWVAVDQDGNAVVYRSMTVSGHNAEMLAHRIREVEMDNDEWDISRGCSTLRGPLDSACWNDTGAMGPSIAETMWRIGVVWDKCDKGPKSRRMAADQFRIRLAKRSNHPTVKDENGKPAKIVPGIRWFDNCWSYVRNPRGQRVRVGPIVTIPVLPADENDPDVPDTDSNDHDYDAISYFCLARPLAAQDQNIPRDELAEFARMRRKAGEAKERRVSGYKNMW